MPTREELVEAIETEACGFGSKRLALKEFRRITGETAIRRLRDLRMYLMERPADALEALLERYRSRLGRAAFPGLI